MPRLAAELGVGEILVKDETCRMGLPSFKVAGASWATYRALEERLGDFGEWSDLTELRAIIATCDPPTLVTATDGNNGHAV